jgi:hypothetical protein
MTARCTLSEGMLSADSVKLTIGERQMSATGRLDLTGRQVDGELLLGKISPTLLQPDEAGASEGRTEVLGFRGDWANPVVRYSTRPSRSARPAAGPTGADGLLPATANGQPPG